MYKQIKLILLLCAASIALNGCNHSSSEKRLDGEDSDMDGGDDDAMIDGPTADLPCGGADLQIDDLNCGECGNKCSVLHADPRYLAGTCKEGECSPAWFSKVMNDPIDFDLVLPPEMTCDEVCAEHSTVCVARGCVGLTGYSCASMWGEGCSLYQPWWFPLDFEGECAEKVPWPGIVDGGSILKVGCCCEPWN